MRKINKIIIHCAATKEGQNFTVADITKWHKARGFATIGYHYVIYLDGSVHTGRPESQIGAHVQGQNSDSIGICYIGGVDLNGKPKDTRTQAQKEALKKLVKELKAKYPGATVLGHRDYSPDRNGDGIIEEWEWMKACPSFDVRKWLKEENI
ncbi:N-acetyl-anhydromuramyl-L-alanine amidase AmpD [Dysgonomonas hofstadii]|uniref:N-acetyl-anhydromuramyl-L-alanine amidase AmpD n=1 Tax=Dysgonomonas hofstadii TaxID=637886 RepID=A0A840CPK5_9BACT|nr:N-acetylmuramoyl-L-alanine amidase [Dysgonomonas hofstadii]MBB4034895.1 N-acetyl-anhydromuramyl-L-alanine amidase AmpD [Dysgonomonas hofstadii]